MSRRKSLLKKRRRHSIIGFEMIRLDRSQLNHYTINYTVKSGMSCNRAVLPAEGAGFLRLEFLLLSWASQD